MIVDIGITLFLILLIAIYFGQNFLKKESLFELKNLFILFAIAEIPYLFYLNHNQDLIHEYVGFHLLDYNYVFLKHIWLKFLFLICALIAMLLFKPRVKRLVWIFNVDYLSRRRCLYVSLGLGITTILFYLLFLDKVGGLTYLLLNMDTKTIVVAGTGWYRSAYLITSMLSLGFYIHYLAGFNRINKSKLFFYLVMLAIYFLILASFGERKNPILLLVYSVILWDFKVNKINIFNAKNALIFSFLILFAALAPVLRKHGTTGFYLTNPALLISESLPYLGEIFKRFSEIDISLFIYSYFSEYSDFWWGASVSDLFTGVIPRGMYPDKPPLDEGVYIYSLAHFYNVHPPTPFNEMLPVGWPLSRVTGGYVHFGVVGVVLNAMLVGMILKYVYNLLKGTSYSPQAMMIYSVLLATNFGITNAFIANGLVMIFMLIIASVCIKLVFRRRSRLCYRLKKI